MAARKESPESDGRDHQRNRFRRFQADRVTRIAPQQKISAANTDKIGGCENQRLEQGRAGQKVCREEAQRRHDPAKRLRGRRKAQQHSQHDRIRGPDGRQKVDGARIDADKTGAQDHRADQQRCRHLPEPRDCRLRPTGFPPNQHRYELHLQSKIRVSAKTHPPVKRSANELTVAICGGYG